MKKTDDFLIIRLQSLLVGEESPIRPDEFCRSNTQPASCYNLRNMVILY